MYLGNYKFSRGWIRGFLKIIIYFLFFIYFFKIDAVTRVTLFVEWKYVVGSYCR
eukprot:SAG11_NODE_1239_length_5424_cov_8.855399_3_plen_54_part_00